MSVAAAGVVLAIDQGTSGTKALVVDPVDGVLAMAEVAVHPTYLPGGGVEQDPHELLESVLTAGRQALAAAGGAATALAIANQGETVLAWDPASGRPLSPAVVWQDRRAEEICAELSDEAETIAARTGLVLDPYFSAPKMSWLRRHITRQGVVTTTDSWLVHHLTGEFVTDVSTASRSLLLDIDHVRWDEQLLSLFGLGDESLPRLVACDEAVGFTDEFGDTMPVGGLVVDQQAALLAQGCWIAGDAKCTFGTGAFLLANTGERALRSAHGLASSVAWRIRDVTTYCTDGQVYAAASAVRWLAELGLIKDASDLDRLASDDANGVLCVPALAGLAAPWWRSDATASITGLTLSSGPEQLVTAVVQGLAAQIAELSDAVAADLGEPLAVLRVDGGLTRSRALMQAVADLGQLRVELHASPHATALGAAALGRMTLFPSLSLDDAVIDRDSTVAYEPRWSADRAGSFRDRWRQLAAATFARETGT